MIEQRLEVNPKKNSHLGLLDGMRGAMAFWVFYGHVQIFSTGVVPRFGHPASAVDVFMFLSGFLMAYQWQGREPRFQVVRQQAIDFYIRRFFRIAPLYYIALFFAIGFQHYFSKHEGGAEQGAWISGVDWRSAVAHLSFAFGAFPKYVSNNVLPDWSIGLEMQFYAVFPLLWFLLRKLGPLSKLLVVLFCGVCAYSVFSLYDDPPKLLGNYPQPGLLFFKLHIFLGGMCIARFYRSERTTSDWRWLVIGATAMLWKTTIQFKGIVFCSTYLLLADPKQMEFFHRALSGKIARFLGDTSYGVYLIHTMVLVPVFMLLKSWSRFDSLPPTARFVVVFILLAPIVYGLAALLHRYVETPGIEYGRRLCAFLSKREGAIHPSLGTRSESPS